MKNLARFLLALAGLYIIGFAWFLAAMPSPAVGVPVVAGLAVFTGGSNRVGLAVEALSQGYSGPVLISGVDPKVKLRQLAPDLADDVARQIELDTAALTTVQNVDNTAAWAARHGIHDVGIITSTYHAARVRLLFWRRAPQLRISIVAVQPNQAGLVAMLHEYDKLLAAPVIAQAD
jgi:uncharacterized SAM-binding protein YcdF (DUF218 family)